MEISVSYRISRKGISSSLAAFRVISERSFVQALLYVTGDWIDGTLTRRNRVPFSLHRAAILESHRRFYSGIVRSSGGSSFEVLFFCSPKYSSVHSVSSPRMDPSISFIFSFVTPLAVISV